ncbi:S8 family serine peptidase [Micromonospora sp. NPDC049559]|uniref:S8 family serine peptidase n=1 Tax=Micromonospora sp. NPDC049559 TaxID=3155923 RepID=UPI00343FB2ED
MIVEFDAVPTIAAAPERGTVDAQSGTRVRQAREAVDGAERGVTEAARRARIALTHRRSYHVLLPGMAVRVPSGQVDALRRLPGVKAVHDVERFQVRDANVPTGNTVASVPTANTGAGGGTGVGAPLDAVPLIGAPQVWQRKDPTGRPVRGTGVTVAVIDTGVDYRHPSLGGGFGPGRKVAGGYDFVNQDTDPADDHGHGTHVAGIIAGTGAGGAMAVTGVAPDATLTAYKVLDADGYGTTEDIVAGIEAAVDPENPYRADVINMSLGGDGDGTDPVGQAATRAAQSGVVVVAAAGNSGPGERTVGSPAAADGVIAVGASTSGVRVPVADLAGPRRERIQAARNASSANPPANPVTGDVVDLGAGTPEDFQRAGDVRGKVLLIAGTPYGGGDLDGDPFIEAERRGALAAVGYNPGVVASAAPNELTTAPVTGLGARDDLRFDRLVILDVTDAGQYQQLRARLDAGRVRVTISGEDATDRIASFSSRGPDPRWHAKPEIVAPGVEIRSSVPTSLWAPGVYRMSGTSMASPHVAGAAALLRQLRPEATAPRVGAALVGSARALPETAPTVSGAGRLDVAAAADAELTAEPTALSFGLADLATGEATGTRTVTLRNDGGRPARLRLAATPAPGSPGTVRITPDRVAVPAGGRATVTVRVTAGAPDQGSGDVSGWLTATAAGGGPALRVPYLLAVRTPEVYVTPDPSDGSSEVFVHTVEPVSTAPTVTLRSPRGEQTRVTLRSDHDLWWRAPITAPAPGVYAVTANVPTATGPTLVGRTTFEVAEPRTGGGWQLVGPTDTGGRVSTTPADPDRLVVAPSYTAGIWLSTDHARSWTYRRLTPVAAVNGQPMVAVDPKRADRIWAAVNGGTDPTYQGRVLRSDDAGASWRVLPFPDRHIDAFAQDSSGGVLVAVAGDQLHTSRDGGGSWTSTPAPFAGTVSAVAFAGKDLYLSTDEGLWRWDGLSGTPRVVRAAQDYGQWLMDVAVAGDTVAVGQRDGTVWTSTDGGKSWAEALRTENVFALSGTGRALLVDAYDQTQLSRDGGRTWTPVAKPVNAITYDLAQWPGDDRTVLLGMEGVGVYATSDAKTFTRLGVPGQQVNRLATTGGNLLVGTESDLFRVPLPGDPDRLDWGTSGGEGMIGLSVRGLEVSPSDPRTVWKLYLNGWFGTRLMRSTDGGATFTQALLHDATPLGLAVHPADARQLFIPYYDLAGAGLLVSRDGGASWKRIDHQTRYAAVAGDPRDARRLWLGDQAGLWRSDDGGATRVKVLDGPVTALRVEQNRIVVGGTELRVSTDGGRTFTEARQLGTGRQGLPIRVSQIVAVGDDLYAGLNTFSAAGLVQGGRGVLRSTDGGRSWANIGAGLPDPAVTALAASPDGRWLFAGTRAGGVYRLPLR